MFITVTVLALCAGARPVAADDTASAESLHREATALTKQGRYADAIVLYKRSQALKPRWTRLCNVGLAYKKLNKFHRAALFLARCKRDAAQAFPAAMQSLLDTVTAKLAAGAFAPVRVDTSIPATIASASYGDDEFATGGETFWLPLGNHTLAITGKQRQARTLTIALTTAGLLVVRSIEFARTPTATAATADAPSPPPATPRALPPRLTPSPTPAHHAPPRRRIATVTWVTLGVGVASLASGGVFHALAVRSRNKAEALPERPLGQPYPEYDGHVSDFQTRRTVAIGLYALGTITTAYATYKLVRSPRSTRSATVGAVPTAGGATVFGRWSF